MNKRGWGGWPTCASLDPHPEAPVLRGPKGTSAQSNSRVSLFNEQCKRHARGLSGFVPMIGAHLCCAFLTMSGGHHRDRRLDQKHCLRDELGGRARQNENLDLSERRTHPAAQSHSRRLARHRGGIGASGLTGDLVEPKNPKVLFRSTFSFFLIEPCGGLALVALQVVPCIYGSLVTVHKHSERLLCWGAAQINAPLLPLDSIVGGPVRGLPNSAWGRVLR